VNSEAREPCLEGAHPKGALGDGLDLDILRSPVGGVDCSGPVACFDALRPERGGSDCEVACLEDARPPVALPAAMADSEDDCCEAADLTDDFDIRLPGDTEVLARLLAVVLVL